MGFGPALFNKTAKKIQIVKENSTDYIWKIKEFGFRYLNHYSVIYNINPFWHKIRILMDSHLGPVCVVIPDDRAYSGFLF